MSTATPSSAATLPPVQVTAGADTGQKAAAGGHGRSGFSRVFHEILDIINPLQHIPVISTIYRHLTGDEISPVAKVAGGALFGGLIGLGLSVADVAVEEATGKDVGDNILALFEGKSDKPRADTAIAAATAPSATAATHTAAADDRIWFPAYPKGSVRTAAIPYRIKTAAPAADAGAAAAAPTATATAAAADPAKATAPDGTPVAMAAARPVPVAATGGAVPQMDQTTFDALLRSFGGKAVAGITPAAENDDAGPRNAAGRPTDTLGAQRAQAQPIAAPTAQPNATAAASGYAGAIKAMEAALDRYQAQGGRIPQPMLPQAARAF